jgi:hypothetical protein
MMDASDLDWAAIAAEGHPYPDGVTASHLAAELTERLTSRDPLVRDVQAYSTAAVWIRDGRFDAVLQQVGDDAAARFRHPEVQARTFAPLVLDLVLMRTLRATGLVADAASSVGTRPTPPGIRPSATPAGGTTTSAGCMLWPTAPTWPAPSPRCCRGIAARCWSCAPSG